jgi:hypothetical protein
MQRLRARRGVLWVWLLALMASTQRAAADQLSDCELLKNAVGPDLWDSQSTPNCCTVLPFSGSGGSILCDESGIIKL